MNELSVKEQIIRLKDSKERIVEVEEICEELGYITTNTKKTG